MNRGLIIIPAFNEGPTIRSVLTHLHEQLEGLADILVVNDGSKDNTGQEASEAGVRICNLPCNLGYAKALKTGLKYGLKHRVPWMAFMDADGQHRAEDMLAIIHAFSQGEHDLMVGSRWMNPENNNHSSSGRRVGMLFFAWLTQYLTGKKLTDTTSGMKIMNPKVAEELLAHHYGDFHAEVLIYLIDRGYRVGEHAIEVLDRSTGTSMYSFKDIVLYPLKNIILITVFKLNSLTLKRINPHVVPD